MTRIEEIQTRLDAVTPLLWECDGLADGDIAPADIAYLLAELRKREPLWEAMDCPDVTGDPFYDDFNQEDK